MHQQQQNMIQNPAMPNEPQTKTPEMNDRDILNDCLSTCKYITDGLNVMALEASHKALYQDVVNMLTETHGCARDLFNVMFEQGHYAFEAAEEQKIQQAEQQFKNYAQNQFPNKGFGMMQ